MLLSSVHLNVLGMVRNYCIDKWYIDIDRQACRVDKIAFTLFKEML